MKISEIKNFDSQWAMALLIKEGNALSTHPLGRSLSREDRQYLEVVGRNLILKAGSSQMLYLPSGARLLVLGAASRAKFNNRKAVLAARQVVALARKERISRLAVYLQDFLPPGGKAREFAENTATQFQMANFEFVSYKSRAEAHFVDEVGVMPKKRERWLAEALRRGAVIGEEINKSRSLANTPGGEMTPTLLADAAVKSGKESGFSVTILDEKEMGDLGMGGVLGVSKGSGEKPKFIIMEYLPIRGKGKSARPVVLVGKGVTFDTGGLNLKPEQGIYEMHLDMSGGSAVIHAIAALARLKIKKNVVGLVPAVENMPSGTSYRPGDLLRTMSGKTIEVLNTDAEGRIILADALTYAKQYEPRLIIDVATLTGASMHALGQRASALFTRQTSLGKTLQKIGEDTGDLVWPMPLWEEYEDDIKGTFGDVANMGKTRYGGVINAAVFLWQFVKDSEKIPDWVHLDIAPRMTAIEGEWLAKGSAGTPIALLVRFLGKF